MPPPSRRSQATLHLSLIMATSLLAYAPSLFGYFLSDDFNVVTLLNHNRTAIDWPNVLSDFYTVYRGIRPIPIIGRWSRSPAGSI